MLTPVPLLVNMMGSLTNSIVPGAVIQKFWPNVVPLIVMYSAGWLSVERYAKSALVTV